MKPILIALAIVIPSAAFAADQQAAPDWQRIAQGLRQQRDTATQALQDAQLQLALAQQQIKADEAKIAELTPKPAQEPAAPAKK